jgi:hypothetical protein
MTLNRVLFLLNLDRTFLKLAAGPEGGGNDPISISTHR